MKNLISILFLLSLLSVTAQTVSTMSLSAAHFTNTTAVTATVQTQLAYENVSIQAVVTKSTGTVAGTVAVSASIDGTNYVALTSSTLALTDVASQTAVFPLTNNNYLYYKVTFTGAGTMDAVPAAYILTNEPGAKRTFTAMKSGTLASVSTTNTATSTLSIQATQWYNTVSLQSVVTKVSGTVAGTVTLQGSLDGNSYVTVSSSYADVTSYSPTDIATSTKIFIVTGSPYRYYRFSYAGAGTMSATHRGYLLPNKKQ